MRVIRLGTRASRLALAQAEEAARAFRARGIAAEIVPVSTRGDRDARAPLSEIGRGAFTDALTDCIARGEIDVAVHSAKDLPAGEEKDGFFCLPRADARDALLFCGEQVGRAGTSSPRRAAALARLFPRAEILPVRGNVDTRLRKLFAGEFDALVLAAAGLRRLGLLTASDTFYDERAAVRLLAAEECVPAACQGVIALEGEAGALVCDEGTAFAARIERRLQRALGGDCAGGIGAYYDGKTLYAQREGRIEHIPFAGEASVEALAGRFA